MISFETFEEIYKPIKNTLVENAAIDGYMFETYGEELDMVKTNSPNKIWTFIGDDSGDYICSGYHIVNKIGYLITEIPFDTYSNITVDINSLNITKDILHNIPKIGDINE